MNAITEAGSFESERAVAPLPSPELLEQYERIVPGTAEKLLLIAKQREERRLTIEKEALADQRKTDRFTQAILLTFVVISMVTGVYLSIRGFQAPALILVLGGAGVNVIAVLIARSARRRSEMLD